MQAFGEAAATLVAALALVAFVLGVVRARSPLTGLGFALDLFLAAALLRLAFSPTYREALVAAIILLVGRVTALARKRAAGAAR